MHLRDVWRVLSEYGELLREPCCPLAPTLYNHLAAAWDPQSQAHKDLVQAAEDYPGTWLQRMNPEPPGTVNGYWMPTIVVDEYVPFDRDVLLRSFREHNIDGRVFFWPLSMLPMFSGAGTPRISAGLYSRAVNLPTYHDLSEADVDRVVACVRAAIGRC